MPSRAGQNFGERILELLSMKESNLQESDSGKLEAKAVEEDVASKFQIPRWAGKPPPGYHLDVMKGDKLIQKLMIDEKNCYFFGRNPKQCDFCVDHASCSRVHAALLYHKQLGRAFLVDLGSTHGTFIDNVLLEAEKPEHVQLEQTFHFGASTRKYVLREKPGTHSFGNEDPDDADSKRSTAKLLGLPEKEDELENLTEYNTALNRRIAAMSVPDDDFKPFRRKKKQFAVSFNEDEQIINPEDVDPSIGRFRNLVYTAVIPTKRRREEFEIPASPREMRSGAEVGASRQGRTSPSTGHSSHLSGFGPLSAKLGLSLPNPAPDVDLHQPPLPAPSFVPAPRSSDSAIAAAVDDAPRKKKYMKEAWPGKKPGTHLLL